MFLVTDRQITGICRVSNADIRTGICRVFKGDIGLTISSRLILVHSCATLCIHPNDLFQVSNIPRLPQTFSHAKSHVGVEQHTTCHCPPQMPSLPTGDIKISIAEKLCSSTDSLVASTTSVPVNSTAWMKFFLPLNRLRCFSSLWAM